MDIVIDADVIIQSEKENFDLFSWFQERRNDSFAVAAITVAELWHGVERASGKQRAKRKRYLQSVLRVLPVLHYTERTAFLHARIWADLVEKGTMIGYYDLIVASTAIEHRHAVASINHKHFSKIPGLRIMNPLI